MQPRLPAKEVSASEALSRLEQAIALRLGPLRVGVEPLLEEARQQLAALEPSPGCVRPPPQEQQERQARLMGVLDQMEDVLEALHLAARGDSSPK
ncbi:MAG TPA: hypothetical protein VF815_21950 [Myxococcaceae bacterium]